MVTTEFKRLTFFIFGSFTKSKKQLPVQSALGVNPDTFQYVSLHHKYHSNNALLV